MSGIRLAIFDLDGVLVDTAEYHYQAWKELAAALGYDLSREENEAFKGVSRDRCMELLCGFMGQKMSFEEQKIWSAWKNDRYVEKISALTREALLPGSLELLQALHKVGILVALGSASKNAPMILQRLQIESQFDFVVDGTMVTRAKPDPQVFSLSAEKLGIPPEDCVVFEDSRAGIEAAHRAGMKAVGVGDSSLLGGADLCVADLSRINPEVLEQIG